MLEKFMMSRVILSVGFSSKVLVFSLLNIMIDKKKGRGILFLYCVAHYLIYNVGFLVVFDYYFGEELWFRLLMPTVSLILGVALPVIMSFVWKIDFAKVLLAFLIADSLSVVMYFPAKISNHPIAIIGFCVILVIIIYRFFTPFLKKYQNYEVSHPWIVVGFAIITLTNGWITNVVYTLKERGFFPPIIFRMGSFQVVFILICIFMEVMLWFFVLKRREKMLLRNKAQMESYYHQVTRHIRETDKTRILLERGSELFASASEAVPDMENAAAGENFMKHTSLSENVPAVGCILLDEESVNLERSQEYLRELLAQYEALGEVFFCNDFAIDSVLREFVMNCREKGIKTDILFHKYNRGIVSAGDAAAILSRMLDYGLKSAYIQDGKNMKTEKPVNYAHISVQGASVRNQLVFSITVTGEKTTGIDCGIRIKKQAFHPWIKKYNGIIHVQKEKNRMQMVVGIDNGTG